MKTDLIPDHPVPLTGEQAEAMEQRQIKKHHIAIILLHWSNAMVWLVELLTGAALISSPHFRVLPESFVLTLQELFGSRANLLRIHVAIGLLWIFVFLTYGVFGFRTYLSQEVLRKEIGLDRDDYAWLRIRILGILGRSKEKLPPQGVYNAGQKLFAMMVYAAIPVIMFTGVVMAFHLFGTAFVGWAALVHFCAVGAVVSGLIVHVYMGAVFPEEKPAFFSMITGTVNELFAYSHHFKWWREVKLEQLAWERAHDELSQPAAEAPAEAAPEAPPQP
jgi:formate dehydrogenase subunit gamma